MVPQDVDWCLSPDMDEYFSINVLREMEKTIKEHPNVTNIACDRLDIYSDHVRVGPPDFIPTNKIHRRHDYTWAQPIYEHLWYKYHDTKHEIEIYNKDIYLVHDQDFKKQSRPELYVKMLLDEWNENPTNCWTLWYLLMHYYKELDLDNFIEKGLVFVQHSSKDERYDKIRSALQDIYLNHPASVEQKAAILKALNA
jgi:hypothetical protein